MTSVNYSSDARKSRRRDFGVGLDAYADDPTFLCIASAIWSLLAIFQFKTIEMASLSGQHPTSKGSIGTTQKRLALSTLKYMTSCG